SSTCYCSPEPLMENHQMKVDLNIGLVVAGGDNSPTAVTERAVEAVRLMAESTLFGRVRSRIEYVAYEDPTGKPVTEATLITTAVCRDRLPSIRHLIHYLAGRLGQDCIAARF